MREQEDYLEGTQAEISLIWILKSDEEKNKLTKEALLKQTISKEQVQLIVCPMEEVVFPDLWIEELEDKYQVCLEQVFPDKAVLLNHVKKLIQKDFVTVVETGDTFSETYLARLGGHLEEAWEIGRYRLGMSRKRCLQGGEDVLSKRSEKDAVQYLDLNQKYACIPYFVAGTWIHADYFKRHSFREDLKYEWEKDYFLHAIYEERKLCYVKEEIYSYDEVHEANLVYFQGTYEPEWYYEAIDSFWVPFLEELSSQEVQIPKVIQYQIMFALNIRVEANLNNLNKHCVPEEEAEEYLWSWRRLLQYVDDEVIMNMRNLPYCAQNLYIKRMFLKIKYNNPHYNLQKYYLKNKIYYGAGNVLAAAQESQKANIQFMEYNDGRLTIDGTIASIFDTHRGRFYVRKGVDEYEIEYNERYSHTKLFGVTIYKRVSFRVEIPIADVNRQAIEFRYAVDDMDNRVQITFDSHTSRLSAAFRNSYWTFGAHFMATYRRNQIVVYTIRKRSIVKREVKLLKEMFFSRKKRAKKFAVLRMSYHVMKPIWKKRPVWMFIDKIYKAGDSSEYLYRYAYAQKDGIDKYYLVDKHSADYTRLKNEGLKPLVRGTLKHRLMFLYADIMVISNSTVFAFNDYDLTASSYMRDLFHFHVACVQHGMSVQKIAVAQNRLRDNIRLYFCASKYEIENLSRPIYDYVGHDALKLTGVPRYDGLIDNAQKQILITPTWRMQAAVPVSKNEGVERSYNPLFKETTYFKIYNSLINDPRLIEAAKRYGYRVLYVLHPIVSPQAEDFDKNDYVDVVPSVGDFSYEKVFRESSLMVSDYSGVQFDFAYMRKPVVYLHHDAIPQHYEEGTFHYDTMAFGEICHNNDELIDVLIEYMKNDCKMKPEYRRRADDFFYYDDHNNCQRIYDIMIHYQRRLDGLEKK